MQIDNEYDRLEAVLVHRPGVEIERLTHDNMRQYLFEDIPYLRRIQDEHDEFVGRMREHRVEVLYLEKLLLDVVREETARRTLLDSVCRNAGVPALADDLAGLKLWTPEQLVDVLFAGLTVSEYRQALGHKAADADADVLDDFLLSPIPNAYFSRDPAVVVRHAAISCKMHYQQRVRETLLIRAVLENHPEFRDNRIAYGGSAEPTEDRPFTVEGGDVIILTPEAVMIGSSERTRSETIERIAGKCFREGHVKRVYEVPIPAERAFMHLDTVFTVMDHATVLWFAPVIAEVRYINRYEPAPDGNGARRVAEDRSLLGMLRDEFGRDIQVIETAGGSRHFGSREQRTDGTNALAIAPRLAVIYERNERTTKALQDQGITCVLIQGSELVRGLGGPRCMTMPLRRSGTG